MVTVTLQLTLKNMNTIINNPPSSSDGSESAVGMVLGIVLVLVLIILFFVYALPALRGNTEPVSDNVNVNVQLPETQPTQP